MKQINNELRELLKNTRNTTIYNNCGIHTPLLSKWKNGIDFQTLDQVNRLAKTVNKQVVLDGTPDDIYKRIYDIVLYGSQDHSIINLGFITGISIGTLANMRRGIKPSLTTLLTISEVLDLDIELELKDL